MAGAKSICLKLIVNRLSQDIVENNQDVDL